LNFCDRKKIIQKLKLIFKIKFLIIFRNFPKLICLSRIKSGDSQVIIFKVNMILKKLLAEIIKIQLICGGAFPKDKKRVDFNDVILFLFQKIILGLFGERSI